MSYVRKFRRTKRRYTKKYKRGNKRIRSLQTINSTTGIVKCEASFTVSSYNAASILYRTGGIDQGFDFRSMFNSSATGGSLTFERYTVLYQSFKIVGCLLEVWPLLDPSTLGTLYNVSAGYSLPLMIVACAPTQIFQSVSDGTVIASDDTLTVGPLLSYTRKYWSLRGKKVYRSGANMVGEYCDTLNANTLTLGCVKFLGVNPQAIASSARVLFQCKLTLYVDFAVTQDPAMLDNAPRAQPNN